MFQNVFITSRTDTSPSLIYLWDDEYGFQTLPYSEFHYAYRRDPNGKLVSLHGDKLTKVRRFDWEDPDLFESDVSRETRVLSDLYLHSDEVSTGHRVVFFDIEVRSKGGFATWMDPFQEVTAISMYSQEEDVYYIFLLDPEQKIESIHESNKILLSCQTEIELLEAFLETYRAVNPTILTGWNTDGYDIPYLYNRLLKVLGPHKANRLSPIDIVKYQQGREKYQIAGVSSLDYLALYKKFTYIQKPSYRLDAIGRDEVGMGKVEYEGTLDDLFHNDLPKFIKYNLTDVEIVVAIDKQKRLIDLVRRICHVGHVPYEDFMYNSKFIEGTILTYLHRKNIIAPNKPAGGREAFEQKLADDSDGFEGAYVRPPFPDLYDWVFSLDLQSLYPSIIMSLNISPETRISKILNWDTEKHMRNQIDRYLIENGSPMNRQEFSSFMKNSNLLISSNGVLYKKPREEIIGKILEENDD
jgi:DNA polymerase elongation subunit (family B)